MSTKNGLNHGMTRHGIGVIKLKANTVRRQHQTPNTSLSGRQNLNGNAGAQGDVANQPTLGKPRIRPAPKVTYPNWCPRNYGLKLHLTMMSAQAPRQYHPRLAQAVHSSSDP
jgi:hypothetical protein